jgi:cytochrome c oxidase subunit 4
LNGVRATSAFSRTTGIGQRRGHVRKGIGTIKAAIVAAVFMELRHRGARTFVFAGAGLFWLGILIWLGMMDFMTRT